MNSLEKAALATLAVHIFIWLRVWYVQHQHTKRKAKAAERGKEDV